MNSSAGWARRAMAVLWPSFLVAGVLEVLVFALVDPSQLRWFGGEFPDLPPAAVHTLAFFLFWATTALAGALTLLLDLPAEQLNEPTR